MAQAVAGDEMAQREVAQLVRIVGPMARALALEYGYPDCFDDQVMPHNPARVPFTQSGELEAGKSTTIDFAAQMGKAATRGHVVNLGDDRLLLNWQGPDGVGFSGSYVLLPGAALDFSSWAILKLMISAPEGAPGEYQVLAQ